MSPFGPIRRRRESDRALNQLRQGSTDTRTDLRREKSTISTPEILKDLRWLTVSFIPLNPPQCPLKTRVSEAVGHTLPQAFERSGPDGSEVQHKLKSHDVNSKLGKGQKSRCGIPGAQF